MDFFRDLNRISTTILLGITQGINSKIHLGISSNISIRIYSEIFQGDYPETSVDVSTETSYKKSLYGPRVIFFRNFTNILS